MLSAKGVGRSEQDRPVEECPGNGRPDCHFKKKGQGASLKVRKDPEAVMEPALWPREEHAG